MHQLADDDVVLDIGAWGKPFTRADWVLDRMPYETRGLYGRDGEEPERFTRERWIQRDMCDRAPFPFSEKSIDFVICSHTLEDIRDPVWVCSEMVRVAKAGYIETPSRLEEQSYGFQGPWVGWGHHHWMVEKIDGGLQFVFKHHVMHGRTSDQFPAGFQQQLTDEERVVTLFWEGGFTFKEQVFDSPEELDPYLSGFVAREMEHRSIAPQDIPQSPDSARRGVFRRRR